MKASGKHSSAGFFLGLFFDPEVGGDMYLRNVGWLSTDFIITAVRTLNPFVVVVSKKINYRFMLVHLNFCIFGHMFRMQRMSTNYRVAQK
jgi:hypothetical protein